MGARASDGAVSLGVVVPTLDEEQALPALLQRLVAADPFDGADQVVVSDGGSRDATRRIATDAGARVAAAPRGRGVQLATGADHVTADVLLFLHADCIPGPGALAHVRAAYADPSIAATAMCQRIDAPGRFYRLVERAANARSRRGIVFGDCGLSVRRHVYRAVGGFRASPLFEDVDLSRRLLRVTQPVFLEPAQLSISARRWQVEGALRCTIRNWMLRVLYDHGVGSEQLARFYAPPRGPARIT